MARPKKAPSLKEQMIALILQAIIEEEFTLALSLLETFKMFSQKLEEKDAV